MKPIDEKISRFLKRYLRTRTPEEWDAARERGLERLKTTLEAAPSIDENAVARISPLEYRFLMAVALLKGDAHNVSWQEKLSQLEGRSVTLAEVYMTMDSLKERGLLRTWLSDSEGGRPPRRYMAVTEPGKRALTYANANEEWATDGLEEGTY